MVWCLRGFFAAMALFSLYRVRHPDGIRARHSDVELPRRSAVRHMWIMFGWFALLFAATYLPRG
jgi:hypothetical protein